MMILEMLCSVKRLHWYSARAGDSALPCQKVIEKIYEAYGNFVKSGIPLELQNDGKYLARGVIEGNVKIEMYITTKGKIVTAYPKL
jgi:hypothetical protein